MRWIEILLLSSTAVAVAAQQQAETPASAAHRSVIKATDRRSVAARRFMAARAVRSGADAAAPAAMRLEAWRQHNAMLQHRALPDGGSGNTSLTAAWQAIGPTQTLTPAFGPVTGRVTSIAIDPSDPTGNTVYLGTTGGGLWKSANAAGAAGNVSFTSLTDTLPAYSAQPMEVSLSVGAVSVAPQGGVVLAGTGDPNDAADSYYGAGLLRSTDGGVSWSLITQSSDSHFGPASNHSFLGEGFAGFAWSTSTPSLVVAAVAQADEGVTVNAPNYGNSVAGLYYSADAGKTWQLATITDGPGQVVQSASTQFYGGANSPSGSFDGNAATSVVWNPVRRRFYAAVRYHGYYESTDGATFIRLAAQPGTNFDSIHCPPNQGGPGSTACPIFRGALAVQAQSGDMFAISVDRYNADQGLWQDACNAAGGSCSTASPAFATQLPSSALEASPADPTIPQGDYNLWLAATPAPGDTLLYAGTEDIYRCSLAAGCNWQNTTNTQTCAAARVAPNQHAIAHLDGSRLFFFGNDGGLWRSLDGVSEDAQACTADDANHFDNLNGGLGSLAEIASFAQHPSDANVLMAAQGAIGTSATNAADRSTPQAWPLLLAGEGSVDAIDAANPQNWYAASGPGVSISACGLGSGCTAADFGAQPVIGDAQVGGDGAYLENTAAWLLDPQDSSQVVVGTCRVWRGPASGGAGWSSASRVSPMLDNDNGPFCNGNAQIRSLAASGGGQPGAAEQMYAGMAGLLDGGSTAAGHLYTAAISSSSTATTAWTDLYLSPVTNDASNSGQFNPGGFDISSIALDPHDSTGATVYATVEGFGGNGVSQPHVYRSTDAGGHWLNISGNLPNAPANAVVVDPNNANTVYVAMDTGVYVTTQVLQCGAPGANCWSVYGVGLPYAPVTQLQVFSGSGGGLLRAGTYGRGLWQTNLAGSGLLNTTAVFTPTTLSFGTQQVQTPSTAQPLTLTNNGSLPLAIGAIGVSGDFSETDDCGASLAAGTSCTFSIIFLPTATGARSGTLTVSGNLPGGQLTATLTGTGVTGAAVVLTPPSLSFGTVAIGSTSAAQNVTISNTGGVGVSLQTPAVTGDFQITADTCGSSLAPNTGCTVAVVFTPTARGARAGTLTVADGVGTQTAALSGNGSSGATDATGPTSLTFAPQPINTQSATQQVTITNTGDAGVTLISAAVAGDFTVNNGCGASLAGHSSCAISVAYLPRSVGSESGTLTITDYTGSLQTHQIALSGTGLAGPGVSLSPLAYDFGSIGVGGTSAVQAITLTNNGGSTLAAPSFAVTGDYSIKANGCSSSLGAGSSCAVQVVFSPTTTGVRSGSLSFSSSSLSQSSQVALTGRGIDFKLVVAGSGTATIIPGQSATYTLSVVPVGDSSGALALDCGGAPGNANCILNPATVTLAGGATSSLNVTVTTSAAAQLRPNQIGPDQLRPSEARAGAWGTALAALACLLPVGCVFRRRPGLLAALLATVLLGLAATGCGVTVTGGKLVDGKVVPPTYNLIVTASTTGLQRSVSLTLILE